jgi:hypothetical protein
VGGAARWHGTGAAELHQLTATYAHDAGAVEPERAKRAADHVHGLGDRAAR